MLILILGLVEPSPASALRFYEEPALIQGRLANERYRAETKEAAKATVRRGSQLEMTA